jgi:hypothetical protein
MSATYQATCTACGWVTPEFPEGYWALLPNSPVRLEHAHREDGELVVLRHPLDESILREYGYTFESARLSGRLVHVRTVFCQECGTLCEVRRVIEGEPLRSLIGQWVIFLVSCVLGWSFGWRLRHFLIGLAMPVLLMAILLVLASALMGRWVRLVHAERVRRHNRESHCPKCGGRKHFAVSTKPHVVPCERCRKPALVFCLIER